MWEVSKEGINLLQDWLNELNDKEMKIQSNRLMKHEKMIFDYDEMMSILEPLSNKFPIYKFIERIKPYVPTFKKKVNPEYEARLSRLRREQEDREYREMTRSVDPNQIYGRENLLHGFGEEMKAVNRQLMVILNTLLTVAGGFSFGYFGIAFAHPDLHLNTVFRIALGLIFATVIFFADLYFIVKGMDDLGEKPIKAKKMAVAEEISENDVRKKKKFLFEESLFAYAANSKFGESLIWMSFRQVACFSNFCNLSRFLRVHIQKFSTARSNHGETVDISRSSTTLTRAFIPFRSIPTSDLGHSILADNNYRNSPFRVIREGGILSPKMVFAAKLLSLSSSAFGLAMVPIISRLAARKPGTETIAAVVDSFFILYAFTPIFLHQILVKRYIVDLYYNPNTEIFTSVHFGFFLGKQALRFRAEDVVDSNRSPDMFRLWFPLATVVIYGKPLMLSLKEETYGDVEIFRKLIKNIKLTS